MRILVAIAVALAIAALVSGCASQVYYSSDPTYLSPGPELYGDVPPGPGFYPGPYSSDFSGYGYYGGPYSFDPYGYGYYVGPSRNGYAGYGARSSSVCWNSGRRIPCPGNAP